MHNSATHESFYCNANLKSPSTIRDRDKSKRILKAGAAVLFASRGYEGTTTRELASAAGVAEGTLFRHFENKKAILIEVATQGWVENSHRLAHGIKRNGQL